jgi:hypothetical protein
MRMVGFFLIIIIFLGTCLWAQGVTKVGTTAARFLNIEVGARAVGMGSAFTTIADDASAIFWNPAGLAQFSRINVLVNHTSWLTDIGIDFAAIGIPLQQWGTLGFGATFLSMDQMEVTTVAQPMGTGEMFDAGSYAFSLSYAKSLTDRFSIGGNFKYIQENIYHSGATGFAFDIGTLFKSQFRGLVIGASISNYGTKMRMEGRDMLIQADVNPLIYGNNENINAHLETDSYDLPLMFRVGLSMDIFQNAKNQNLVFAVDALHPNDDTESLNLGLEYGFKKMFFLRTGYRSLFARDSETGWTAGVGVWTRIHHFTDVRVDYAYQDFGILKNIQMFGIDLTF